MSKFDLKPKVFALRKSGKSIGDIAKIIGISKSTVSAWCSDIKLTENQKTNLYEKMKRAGNSGRIKGAQANKTKKLVAQEKARLWAKSALLDVTVKEKMVVGVALYWTEGSKANTTTGFVFVNSDPKMIKFMHEWLINFMGVLKKDIVVKISVNESHKYRINKILNFWANLLDLPRSQFLDTFFQKTAQKKVYQNHDIHYGVLRLGVRKSTFLKYQILALIEELKAGVAQVARASHS